MADFRAIRSVGEALMGLFESSYRPADFNDIVADFRMFTSRDFTRNAITNGASLFMYRVYCNGTYRTPPGRIGADGKRMDTELPLELHFLITLWGGEASYQYELAGWIMRLIEDSPTLPASVLNSTTANVFRPDETVDIHHAELKTEDLFRIWDVLGVNAYQLSIPYVARVVNIESTHVLGGEFDERVQERIFDMAVIK
jgi:Pvc16 N-terminal domain